VTYRTPGVKGSIFGRYDRLMAQQRLLDRHRTWPVSAGAADMDSLLSREADDAEPLTVLEFDRYRPVAIVEYKYGIRDHYVRIDTPSVMMQRTLAHQAGVDFYICQYFEDDWTMRWRRMRTMEDPRWTDGTETDWVRHLMKIRHRALPANWSPAPITPRPKTYDAIASELLEQRYDPTTVARFLTRLMEEYE
jgi:hypothetical protein